MHVAGHHNIQYHAANLRYGLPAVIQDGCRLFSFFSLPPVRISLRLKSERFARGYTGLMTGMFPRVPLCVSVIRILLCASSL